MCQILGLPVTFCEHFVSMCCIIKFLCSCSVTQMSRRLWGFSTAELSLREQRNEWGWEGQYVLLHRAPQLASTSYTHTQNQLTDLLDTSYPPDLHLHPSCPHTAVCKSIVSTVGLDTETDTGELKVRCTQYGEVVWTHMDRKKSVKIKTWYHKGFLLNLIQEHKQASLMSMTSSFQFNLLS